MEAKIGKRGDLSFVFPTEREGPALYHITKKLTREERSQTCNLESSNESVLETRKPKTLLISDTISIPRMQRVPDW